MAKWNIAGILAAVTLIFGACTIPATPIAQEPIRAVPAPQVAPKWLGSQFDDVPLPPDLVLDYDVSYMNVSSNSPRVADLRYTGQASPTDVLTYMQRAMSASGWQPTSVTGAGVKTLRFVKVREECVLVIHPGKQNQTVLMVRIHPRL